AVRIAFEGHPRIKGAEQDVVAGSYRTMEARATYWPQVSFEASRNSVYFERLVRIGGQNITTQADYIANNFTFNGNWTVFDFGRTYYNAKSLKQIEAALGEDLSTTEQGVVYDVMDAYFTLLRVQALVKVAEDALAASEGHLRQAQAFFDVGTKPRFDVTSAEVEVNNAKLLVIQAKDAVKAARIGLNTRIGIDPLTPTVVEDRPLLDVLEKPMEGYFADAIANRPELGALDARYKSNELAVRREVAGYLPTLSVSGQYNWYKEDHTDFLNNHNVQVTADVPILEGFRTRARVGQARAAALSSMYRVEDAKKDILNEVSRAYVGVEDSKARLDVLEYSVKKAAENVEIAQGRYEAGVGPIIDVTDAQVALTRAQADQAQAFYDYHLAFSRLMRNTGRRAAQAAR
ncbi:MAG TPA: TolC family protein, partial [Nitrospirota bacterium]|nr:TolC family protein [Nitrospirota bacterium]